MVFQKRKEKKREKEIENLMKQQEEIAKKLKELSVEEGIQETEEPTQAPQAIDPASTGGLGVPVSEPQIVKPKEVWVLRNIPVEYKPGIINVKTNELFVARDAEEARYWARNLNMQEQQKEALVG